MSGYVGRNYNDNVLLGFDLGVQFHKNKKGTHLMIFADREEACRYFKMVEGYSDDDLQYLFWFEEGEDRKRSLLTGELLVPPEPPEWLPEDDILPEEEDDDDD